MFFPDVRLRLADRRGRALEIEAIDSANMVLRITGKGDKQRLVPLPRPLLNDLRNLWRTHHNPRWLFPKRDGTGPICRVVLGQKSRSAIVAAGIDIASRPTVCVADSGGSRT